LLSPSLGGFAAWRPSAQRETINIGMKMIKPDFRDTDFTPLYLRK
jgi:hypothetical protein